MSIATTALFVFLMAMSYGVAPFTLIFGWTKWIQHPGPHGFSSCVSLSGFVLATASAGLAIFTIAFANVHPFRFYDPSLMRIMKSGMLLSLAALLLSIGGVWRRNTLRWLSPACALGTLAFWVLAAEGE